MPGIWLAAIWGDLAELQRLVGQDPGLLDATLGGRMRTPLMLASAEGHVAVVRWLLDKGAAINAVSQNGHTALFLACNVGNFPVVRLLVEGGADPTIASDQGSTPLIHASFLGHLEIVRLLLAHPSAKATINHRSEDGQTALFAACHYGRGRVVRALLESGADPTISSNNGWTTLAIAKHTRRRIGHDTASAEGRRECVAALEVRLWSFPSLSHPPQRLLL
jgi:ankyrin repeat protein